MAGITITTFVAPWGDPGIGLYGVPRYWKDSFGYVHLSGLSGSSPASSGSPTQAMFQLPAGYRPGGAVRAVFICHSFEGGRLFARVDVDTSGNFIYMAGGREWVVLTGISYLAGA